MTITRGYNYIPSITHTSWCFVSYTSGISYIDEPVCYNFIESIGLRINPNIKNSDGADKEILGTASNWKV